MSNAILSNAPVGANLANRLLEAPLPVSAALRLGLQLADALRTAHERGTVYGGLDPAQITFPDRGPANLLHPGSPAPCTAPEVIAGQPADVRSDVFVFGALLYHLLTGRQPYAGHDSLHGEGQPPAIETFIDATGPVPAETYAGLARLVL